MLNQNSINAVNASRWRDHFTKPLHDSYTFARIPQLVKSLLTDDANLGLPPDVLGSLPHQYDRVVLLFIDAFGWMYLEKYADKYPFLKRFLEEGVVSKLTSQFPSTTSAHVTTIHSGLPVNESGVFEWYYYEPVVDDMISPLTYSFAGEKKRNSLLFTANILPEQIFPQRSLYQDLLDQGVPSFAIQHREFAGSPHSDVTMRGAHIIPHAALSDAVVILNDLLSQPKGYFFFYYGLFDALCHHYGPHSPHAAAELDILMTALEHLFFQQHTGKLKNTLLLLTADHGHMPIDPATTIYINQKLPQLLPLIRTNRMGKLLVPGGSARDMFLYIEPPHIAEAQAMLSELLAGRAEVYTTETLIQERIFDTPSQRFLDRVGNLVILPYANESVWWYEEKKFEQTLYGQHGGLTTQEMETILLAYAF